MLPNSKKGKQISFGQGPRPEASANPQSGHLGTHFSFNATKFDRGVDVNVQIVDSQRRVVYQTKIATNENGSIGGLNWVANAGLPIGQYSFLVTGKCNGKIQTASKFFYLAS